MAEDFTSGGLSDAAGRITLVTGGTRGIGAAISRRFLAGGWDLLVTARSKASFGAFVGSLDADERARVGFLEVDFLRYESMALFLEGVEALGRLDALVNNAGDNINNPLSKLRFEDVERLYRVNLEAPIRLMKAAASVMSRSGGGWIVNIASIWSVIAREERLAYAASKSGLVGATRTAAVDLAGEGILVNAVSPGCSLNELTARTLSAEDVAELYSRVPVGRFAQPDEVAGLV